MRRGIIKSRDGWTWASDQYLTLPPLFRLDEEQIRVFIRRLEMPISLVLGDQGFFKEPLFLYDRIKLCRDIRVETFEGGHHLHLEGAERDREMVTKEALNGMKTWILLCLMLLSHWSIAADTPGSSDLSEVQRPLGWKLFVTAKVSSLLFAFH